YGQRLRHRQRNVLAHQGGPSTGVALLAAAQHGGAQALGQSVGRLAPGHRADFVTLNPDTPGLLGRDDDVFDAYVFSAGRRAIEHVFVGGRQVIADGRHPDDEAIRAAARDALESLAS
ncbi:MAG: amidohydrolase family protein, partial [Pseudomonadota bacterium]